MDSGVTAGRSPGRVSVVIEYHTTSRRSGDVRGCRQHTQTSPAWRAETERCGKPPATDLDVLGGAVLADGVYVG